MKRIFLFFIMISFICLSGCGGIIPSGYTITSTAGSGGSITPPGVISVTEGGNQTFTFTPDSCYQINDVLVDGISEGSITTYTFTDVQENHTIQVSFVVIPGPRVLNTNTEATYTTIQAAINASLEGETIIVCPGTYYENLIINEKNITLQSTNPLDPAIVSATIIDGGGSDYVVGFGLFGEGDASTLKGFTIQNGEGIYIYESSPVIENNIITNNEGFRGGIYVNSSSPTITANTITDNEAKYGGGGISVLSSSSTIIIENNIIHNNKAKSELGSGGGISLYYNSGNIIITNNTITDNEAEYGGGISVYHSNPTITENTINNNVAYNGGGIKIAVSNPTITNNIITDNEAIGFGGGIYVCRDSKLLPTTFRPIGWGNLSDNDYRWNLPPDDSPVAGNSFSGNSHSGGSGANVYFY